MMQPGPPGAPSPIGGDMGSPTSSIPERPPPPPFNSTPAPTCPNNPQTDEEKRQVCVLG